MKLVIDRFEGDQVICEAQDRSIIVIPIKQFNKMPVEGSIVSYENNRAIVDEEAATAQKKEIQRRFEKLLRREL